MGLAVFNQLLGSNQSKTAGTSLVISPVSKTVTKGRWIFVGFAADDVGSAFGVTDNLGNFYAQAADEVINTGNVKTQLWRSQVSSPGSITSITISWTTNITAKAAVAGEYSNFGSERLRDSSTGSGASGVGVNNLSFFTNELWICAVGVEDDVAPLFNTFSGSPTQTAAAAGSNGTSGGGSATNISVALGHFLIDANSSSNASLATSLSGTQDWAGTGVIYNAALSIPPRLWPPSVYHKRRIV